MTGTTGMIGVALAAQSLQGVQQGVQQTVLDGSMLLAVPLAVAAGLVSFL